MNLKFVRPLFGSRRAWSPIRRVGLATVLMLGANVARSATPITDAPTVAPAPLVDKPLAPAVADSPGEAPSPQHVWIPGHWRWLEGAYVWETGRWEIPPVANVTWVNPAWVQQGNGYVLKDGYWQQAPAPAPVVVTATQPADDTFTSEPPPPPQAEVIYERPSGNYVWVGGYWGLRAGRHVWIAGHWDRPPRANVVWVAPRWERRGNGYVLIAGYWRDVVAAPPASVLVTAPPPPDPAPQQQVVIVSAPPPPRAEVVYARPGPGYVWINGYWAWRAGRYVWIAGHYELPPRGMRTWSEPRWERRGGSYIMIEGHWGR